MMMMMVVVGVRLMILYSVLAMSSSQANNIFATSNKKHHDNNNNYNNYNDGFPPALISDHHFLLSHNNNENEAQFHHYNHKHHRFVVEEEENELEDEDDEDGMSDDENNNNNNNNNSDKRLVIFIGPRKAGSSSVEKFFYTHASSSSGHHGGGLNGWIWPTYPGINIDNVPPHKVFSLYMEKPSNVNLQNKLDRKIQEAWDSATNGVIIGSELFDRILDDDDNDNNDDDTSNTNGNRNHRNTGKKNHGHKNNNNNNHHNNNNDNHHNNNDNNNHHNNNDNHNNNNNNHNHNHDNGSNMGAYGHNKNVVQNAAVVLEHLQDLLELSPEQITIILNYRTPRFDQWVSLFSHHTNKTEEHYRHFLCQKTSKPVREELLATTMNPFGISEIIINKFNYQVVVVDMAGAAIHNIEISHAILCHVLLERTDGSCGDDVNLDELNAVFEEDQSHEDHHSVSGLGHHQRDEVEQLFLERDCYYKDVLEDDPKFTILYQDTIWKTCSENSQHKESYANLANGDTLLYALQAQKNCAHHFMKSNDVHSLLVGNSHEMTQQTAQQQSEENVLNAMEEEPIVGDVSELFGKDSSLSSTFSDEDAPIIMGIFVLIATGIGLFSLIVGGRRIIARRPLNQRGDVNLDDSEANTIEFSGLDRRNIV